MIFEIFEIQRPLLLYMLATACRLYLCKTPIYLMIVIMKTIRMIMEIIMTDEDVAKHHVFFVMFANAVTLHVIGPPDPCLIHG